MTAEALSPPSPEPRQLSLAELRTVFVLGRGAKGVVFHVVPGECDDGGGAAMALKAVSWEAARHKKVGSGGGDGHRRLILFERDVLLALHHPLLHALHGSVATDAVVGFAIDRCGGGEPATSAPSDGARPMFSDSVIRTHFDLSTRLPIAPPEPEPCAAPKPTSIRR